MDLMLILLFNQIWSCTWTECMWNWNAFLLICVELYIYMYAWNVPNVSDRKLSKRSNSLIMIPLLWDDTEILVMSQRLSGFKTCRLLCWFLVTMLEVCEDTKYVLLVVISRYQWTRINIFVFCIICIVSSGHPNLPGVYLESSRQVFKMTFLQLCFYTHSLVQINPLDTYHPVEAQTM